MKLTKFFLGLAAWALLAATTARAGAGSTITFDHSDHLTVTKGKKHNFKQDVEAVSKAHDTWKKAHLNETLYSCQRNSEQVATLARKVSDRIEATKKATIASARALESTVSTAIGAESTEVPETLGSEAVNTLKAKADQLATARKQADILERLSAQVMKFYEYDMPKESAVDGNCVTEYRAAMQKGVAASVEYHADSAALSAKIDKLAQIAQTAWREAEAKQLLAAAK